MTSDDLHPDPPLGPARRPFRLTAAEKERVRASAVPCAQGCYWNCEGEGCARLEEQLLHSPAPAVVLVGEVVMRPEGSRARPHTQLLEQRKRFVA